MQDTIDLYDTDFFAWTQEQAKLIKEKTFSKLDITHLFEEVEDMGNRHADELESRLELLLMHLLKWKYQPSYRGASWELTIKEQRNRIKQRLKKMPSLKSKLNELFLDAYDNSIYDAAKETGLNLTAFPISCEWTKEQILDADFFPN